MSDKTLVERLRELQNRDCACITQCDFVNAVGAKCCREMQGYGCNLCFNVTIKAIIDAIESEYLQRPRFEDGEPVQFGDMAEVREDLGDVIEMVYQGGKCVEVVIGFGDEETASHYMICEGERVKRPEPEVLDADGVPIRVGDTVWNVNTGERCTVKEITTRTKNAFKGSKVITHTITVEMKGAFYKDGTLMSLDRCNITHKEPDSLERIEADAEKTTRDYWECYGVDCLSCPARVDEKNPRERYGAGRCQTAMTLDLLYRQREVLERDHER